MDMKRILQAMNGVATKPVVGADSMAKFLCVVNEAELNQPIAPAPASTLSPEQLAYNQLRAQLDGADAMRGDADANTFTDVSPEITAKTTTMRTKLAQMAAALQAKDIDAAVEYDAQDPAVPATTPVDLNQKYATEEVGISRFLSIVNEGKSHRSAALPVQMAMQHYQQPASNTQPRERLIDKYFVEAETAITHRKEEKRALINQYAKTIAERVMMKESVQGVAEAPIAMDPAEPNNPTIHNHEKANTMSLKSRIASARAQLKELAQLAESNELVVWEKITRLSKGGMFMGLEQNLEQIRHGISELAEQRRKGGVASRGIDKHITAVK